MSILKNLNRPADLEGETDSVGSSILPSGLYDLTITKAFLIVSKGGANALALHAKTDSGVEIREDIYFTSGTAKGGKSTYTDKNTGKERPLPGLLLAESISLLTVGKKLDGLDEPENKVIKLYDHDASKEMPKEVPMLMELVGQKIKAGVIHLRENKKDQHGEIRFDDNEQPLIRDKNTFDKFFRGKDSLTVPEITAGITEAIFSETWEGKWKDKINEKVEGNTSSAPKPKTGGFGSSPTSATTPNAAQAETENLFGGD